MSKKNRSNNIDEEDLDLGYNNFESNGNDRQYNAMLPKTKGGIKQLSYFRNSQKYAGKVDRSSQHKSIDNQDQNQQESQEQQVNNGVKQALISIKNKNKQRSNLLMQDLKKIENQDNQNIIKMKNDQKLQGNPQALQNQLNQFNKLSQIRYFSQKNLEQLKKFPINNYPVSQSLHLLQKESEKATLTNIQALIKNYQVLASDFFQTQYNFSNYKEITQPNNHIFNQKRLNVQKLWQKFEQQTKQINQKIQQQIINWSQRTVLLKNSASRTQYNSLLMQTPIGQAKKAINDWEKVSKKCQQKRSPFRILFQGQQNLKLNSDKNIYDDLDLLQQVQKNYEQQLEKQDKDFLVNDTLKYLQNKSKIKISKDVDRKASKNRKVRYNVHPKLLNFMPSQTQNFLEARDQIVKNIFNKGTYKQQQAVDFIDI